MILKQEELAEITRRDRPGAQGRVLRALGIPYRPHPTDPMLLVPRAPAEAVLGGQIKAGDEEWAVDVEGVEKHGQKAA